MKQIVFAFLFSIPFFIIAQPKSNYEFVVVQEHFVFLAEKNQYNLNELTKFLIAKEGLIALYDSEEKPVEFSFDKCKVLHLDLSKEKSFLNTKLQLTLSDCNGEIVAQSAGSSKEKDFRVAYNYALRDAFNHLIIPAQTTTTNTEAKIISEKPPLKTSGFLYAQKTNQGFDLFDHNNIEQYKLYASSNGAYFLISGQDKAGILYKSNQEWVFEYINDQKLVSQVLKIKF